MKRICFLMLPLMFISATAHAEIKGERIEYQQGTETFEGYLAYDDAVEGKRPGIIVVHDWMGFGEYGNKRAEMLAKLGYVALAVDIYGKGVRPQNSDEASEQATKFKQNRKLLRQRVAAGLEALKQIQLVDPSRTAAIGYCFGGTTVLELARSGADVTGVVSFHGGLDSPNPQDGKNIKAKVLVLHGANDPYVSASDVAAFQKELRDAKVDWQMVYYSGAVHSFTNKDAGNDPSQGVAYNENVDKRSWEAMKSFFDDIFGNK